MVLYFHKTTFFSEMHKILRILSVTKSFSTSLAIENFVSLRDCNNFEKAQGIWEEERITRTREKKMFF